MLWKQEFILRTQITISYRDLAILKFFVNQYKSKMKLELTQVWDKVIPSQLSMIQWFPSSLFTPKIEILLLELFTVLWTTTRSSVFQPTLNFWNVSFWTNPSEIGITIHLSLLSMKKNLLELKIIQNPAIPWKPKSPLPTYGWTIKRTSLKKIWMLTHGDKTTTSVSTTFQWEKLRSKKETTKLFLHLWSMFNTTLETNSVFTTSIKLPILKKHFLKMGKYW